MSNLSKSKKDATTGLSNNTVSIEPFSPFTKPAINMPTYVTRIAYSSAYLHPHGEFNASPEAKYLFEKFSMFSREKNFLL